jgi:hypothetical protein
MRPICHQFRLEVLDLLVCPGKLFLRGAKLLLQARDVLFDSSTMSALVVAYSDEGVLGRFWWL